MRYAQLALVAFTSYGHFATAAPVNNGWFSGWFTSWSQSAGSSTPSDYNELSFFAALTTQDGLTISDGSPDVAFKPALQGATDTTPLLSIGGWAGSQYVREAWSYESYNRTLIPSAAVLFTGEDCGFEDKVRHSCGEACC